jgi:hypothetical protein
MTGEQLTTDAIDAAAAGADEGWLRRAVQEIRWLASVRPTFTSDQVWAVLEESGVSTREPRALGAAFREAQRAGYIRPTGQYVPTQRPEAHNRPIRVWAAR